MLASSAWHGGAASCTATLENWDSYGTRGKVSTLASTTFDVSVTSAVRVPAGDVESHLEEIDSGSTVIAYCTCPSEQSSLEVAKSLMEKGYSRVFALRGGFDAWVAAGYPIEMKTMAA